VIERLPVGLRRLGYRIAYAGLVAASLLVRPRTRGVKCLITDGPRALLVRPSYGARDWDLPGGFCRRSEAFLDAARREVREEVGIVGGRWVELGELTRRHHGRRETLGLVAVEVRAPALVVDPVELLDARWFELAALPPDRSALVDHAVRRRGFPPGAPG
jgi:ADP-ribose pyrophosphatase YjhB (NUDIX family)